MITQKQAEELVCERLNRKSKASPDWRKLVICRVDERPFGWVISWTSRRHHETGDIRDSLIGSAPFYVSRADGALRELGPVPLIQKNIIQVERELREQHSVSGRIRRFVKQRFA